MAGNNGLVGRRREIGIRGRDHPFMPTGRVIDEGVDAVPKRVGDMHDAGFPRGDGNIAVGVARTVVLERDGLAVELEIVALVENVRR